MVMSMFMLTFMVVLSSGSSISSLRHLAPKGNQETTGRSRGKLQQQLPRARSGAASKAQQQWPPTATTRVTTAKPHRGRPGDVLGHEDPSRAATAAIATDTKPLAKNSTRGTWDDLYTQEMYFVAKLMVNKIESSTKPFFLLLALPWCVSLLAREHHRWNSSLKKTLSVIRFCLFSRC